ncbi:unnamed protein product [Sympodiomycopsis kandeliae]
MSAIAKAINHIGVIGSGQMGLGIAYVAAVTAQSKVLLCDTSQTQLNKSLSLFDTLLAKDVKKSKLTQQQADEARSRLSVVEGIDKMAASNTTVQMVVEAATENLSVKQKIFGHLAKVMPEECILATNTSSISVSKIAASALKEGEEASLSKSPSRCLGLHFMNPVPVLKLVELIPALQTTPEVVSTAKSFAERCGKTVVLSKDTPAFIANRLLMPYINEAIIVYSEGVATKEDIDTTMKLGMSHPMGPLTLADFIGLDTCLYIMQTMYTETGDSKYRPATLLGRMVDAGWVGKKGGKGFYDYTS